MKALRKASLFLFLVLALRLASAAAEVKVLNSPQDLPEKFSSLARKDDILISGSKALALIGGSSRSLRNNIGYQTSNALGSLIGFGPVGLQAPADVNIGSPVLRLNNRSVYVPFVSISRRKGAAAGHVVFEASGVYEDKEGRKAALKTVYDFAPDAGLVDISSSIVNTGKVPFSDLGYSVYSDSFNNYSFNPYNEKKFPRLNFRVNQKNGHSLGWINLNPPAKSGTIVPGKLVPGETYRVHYFLLTEASGAKLLQEIYSRLNIQTSKAEFAFKDFRGGLLEISVRETMTGAAFFRAFRDNMDPVEIPLPEGIYRVRANLFPAVVEDQIEVRSDRENKLTIKGPASATLSLKIRNSRGEFVPGKVTFIGLDPTKTPYFVPTNPSVSGRSFESFKNSCYPTDKGLDIDLPVGTYLAYAARGPEYSVAERVIEVLEGEKQEHGFVIDKVVDTAGLVSLDPHTHTQNSDGYVSIEERLKSLAAEGLDAAVATDHNYVTDYAPALKDLGLSPYLAVLPGSEVTINGMIHYCTYPMQVLPGEETKGATSPLAEYPSELFKASRQKNPSALLQVNHPRAGDLGYFNNYLLDQESAANALVGFDLSFDLLEVMNGVYPYSSNSAAVKDWLNLLNRGYYFPAIGSSDVHGIDRSEPGYSRTYIAYRGKKAGRLDWAFLLQALKKGRSFVSNGPLVEFKINGKHAPGDTLTAKSGKVKARIKVWSAPWIEVSEVRLIVNGERTVKRPVIAKAGSIVKFKEDVSLTLDKDSYVILEVVGRNTLYPVHQEQQKSGQLKDAAVPYALTNPVFIDVDGNGVFDPPLKEKVKLLTEIKGAKKVISRF